MRPDLAVARRPAWLRSSSLIALAVLVGACAAPPPPTPAPDGSSPVVASASPTGSQAPVDCARALGLVTTYDQRLVDKLVQMRGQILANRFDPSAAHTLMRSISAEISAARAALGGLAACPPTPALASDLASLWRDIEAAANVGLVASILDANAQRSAGRLLVALTRRFTVIADESQALARAVGADLVALAIPASALEPLPTPLPTPTAPPTPPARPTLVPTPPPAAAGSGWTKAAYDAAVAYQKSAWATYAVSIPKYAWLLAYWSGCVPGVTEEECAAARKDGGATVKAVRAVINSHLSYLKKHPAARCYQDAYAADRSLAARYLAWLSHWGPYGGEATPEGTAQLKARVAIDAKATAFLSGFSAYFTNCR